MTLDEALSAVVTGYKARHNGMAEGQYIHYDFDGFRQNGKPWGWDGNDQAADWYVIDPMIKEGEYWDTMLTTNEVEPEPISIKKTGKFDANS